MSDSLPENNFKEVLKVLKLASGEEVVGLITEADAEFVKFRYPALLQNYLAKDEKGNILEYVKLLNYLVNVNSYCVEISKKLIIYIGEPSTDLKKMYELFYIAMQTDPKSVANAQSDSSLNVEPGLYLLNDLFNNEDFVGFVNDLIDTFDGIEITDEMEEALEAESVIEPPEEPTPKTPPKRKKRKGIKPETNKLPYNPNADPNTAESWSDNPSDYL